MNGQHQISPFGSLQLAAAEFCKVFASKSKNKWEARAQFVKQPKMYRLHELKYQKELSPLEVDLRRSTLCWSVDLIGGVFHTDRHTFTVSPTHIYCLAPGVCLSHFLSLLSVVTQYHTQCLVQCFTQCLVEYQYRPITLSLSSTRIHCFCLRQRFVHCLMSRQIHWLTHCRTHCVACAGAEAI